MYCIILALCPALEAVLRCCRQGHKPPLTHGERPVCPASLICHCHLCQILKMVTEGRRLEIPARDTLPYLTESEVGAGRSVRGGRPCLLVLLLGNEGI